MGLSVGVVNIEYLDEPESPVSDFLKELAANPEFGIDDGDSWGGGWAENTFIEFQKSALMERAKKWCAQKGIGPKGRTSLMTWIASLPYRNECVILHLGD